MCMLIITMMTATEMMLTEIYETQVSGCGKLMFYNDGNQYSNDGS